MRYRLFILLILMVLASNTATADNWIGIGIPTIYRFSEVKNSPLSSDSDLQGTPSGYIIYGSIYEKPFIGYEKYQISLNIDHSDEVPAIINIEFLDIGLQFSQRYTSQLIGYGYGSIKTECKISSCSDYEFEEGIARQYFFQFAVQIYEMLSLQLSANRVLGENAVTIGSSTEQMVLDGMMYAFGLKLNWR